MSNKLNYLDKKGLAKVFSILKFGHKKIWHGTLAEWDALSATEKAKYDQAEVIDEYTGVPVVVDKVEAGNLNPVTSNAVYDAMNDVKTITPAPVTGGAAGTPDYAHPKTISGSTWTADEDVWVNYTKVYPSNDQAWPAYALKADDVVVSTTVAIANSKIMLFAGRIPKGTVLKSLGLNSTNFYAWPFKA